MKKEYVSLATNSHRDIPLEGYWRDDRLCILFGIGRLRDAILPFSFPLPMCALSPFLSFSIYCTLSVACRRY